MQVFLQHMLGMLPVLGVHAFEQPPQAPAASAPELTCKGKGLVARGYESTQGFVVKAGRRRQAKWHLRCWSISPEPWPKGKS